MKIVTIIGARPQFIKAATVSHVFQEKENIDELLVHTGQHFDANMSEVFFDELGIPEPKYNLGLGGGLHGEMTGAQLAAIEEVLVSEKPEWVMVYGDTNSTLAGALAASKLNIPVAHVEAGLRSFNRKMPEEINRVLTDHMSSVLFAPTDIAMDHLGNEGIANDSCYQVGDVMYDATLLYGEKAAKCSTILQKLGVKAGGYMLTTIHRAENTDNPERLHVILSALREVAKEMPVIWPVHPRTGQQIYERGLGRMLGGGVQLIEPVGYLDMIMLEQRSAVIATDSGGVQKEAFFCGVPCVTVRDETEWVELVASGWNRIAPPTDVSSVAGAILESIGTKGRLVSPYGSGDAGKKITNILENYSGK